MFKSFDHVNWEGPWTTGDATPKNIKLIDDDFECWISDIAELEVEIVREYSNRKLDVGRNLTLFVIYYSENLGNPIYDIIDWQEDNLPDLINDWAAISKERDYWLKKYGNWM